MGAVVKDVMTATVIWVEQDTPFAAMAAALRQYRVSAFPVLNSDGQVIGVVSETDLLAKEALAGEAVPPAGTLGIVRSREHRKARGTTARDLMTSPAITISPGATVKSAAELMYRRGVKRLPVVDADRHLVGVVSRSDVLAVYRRPDEDIRQEILADILLEGCLAHPDTIGVEVEDGVVTLAGVAEPAAAGREIARRVARIEGVVAVEDHLGYVPGAPGGIDPLADSGVD